MQTFPGFLNRMGCSKISLLPSRGLSPMTNTIAIWLVVLILGLFLADQLYFEWDLHIAIGREFLRLLNTVAFWR